jgi:methylmalonyl-CoA/ethylmalonyl-CoA epimerase
MSIVRRLDHVAVAVRDTEAALRTFRDRYGLEVAHSEELEQPSIRLTYLDVGNTYIQLVEPLDPAGELAHWLDENGEGLHHVCFGVDDPLAAATRLSSDGGHPAPGTGRGRVSAFVPGDASHGVVVECTEFSLTEDVGALSGWLA